MGCSSDTAQNNNPYLPSYPVSLELNMNLPSYSSLAYVSNAVIVSGYGVRGVVVFNSGSGYYAFDLACPNQALSTCSTMSFKKLDTNDPLKIDKTTLVCPCDNAEYSLFNGQSKGLTYSLKQYRVEQIGNTLRVYN